MIILYVFFNVLAAVSALNAYNVFKVIGNSSKKKNRPEFTAGYRNSFKKYGITSKTDLFVCIMMPFSGLLMAVASLASGKILPSVILLLTPIGAMFFILAARKKRVSMIFQKNAYKLYKYILNQNSAGVRPSDAIKRMYEVIEDKTMRKTFMEACAKFSVSLDNDILADEIIKNIDTPESRSFAMTIRDRIFENGDSKLLERLEQLMFNRYFAYIQRSTDNVKTRCLLSVLLLCSVIVVMVLIPTMLDVQNAMNSIFTQ